MFMESDKNLESWSKNVPWDRLAAKRIVETEPETGKITLNNGQSYYICEFGGLIYLQESPNKTTTVENLNSLEGLYMQTVIPLYPPRSEYPSFEVEKKDSPYANSNMAIALTIPHLIESGKGYGIRQYAIKKDLTLGKVVVEIK